MAQSIPHHPNELPVTQPRYVGKDVPRVEDTALLTGTAEFTNNLSLPSMLHAAVLQSPHAHARIKRIDTSKAEKLKGVVAIITGEYAEQWSGPVLGFPNGWTGHCLAKDKVRFVGEPIAGLASWRDKLLNLELRIWEKMTRAKAQSTLSSEKSEKFY